MVVVGLARSGCAAAAFLAHQGCPVVATDRKPLAELSAEAQSLAAMGIRLETGGHSQATFRSASLVVVSPGVPSDLPELALARGNGIAVIGELELAYRNLKGRMAAVTGTKGKSTTTAALGAMLREDGGDVRVGGNIGEALVGLVQGSTSQTRFAVEVSSFQLETIVHFRADVAVLLNLTPDHLDRHPSLDDYAAAKLRIFENQSSGDVALLGNTPEVMERAGAVRARQVILELDAERGDPPHKNAAFFRSGQAQLRFEGAEETLFSTSTVKLPGAHLLGDLLAAASAARILGATPAAIARAVASFRGAEHVLEHVRTLHGVDYYNDSKATNVEAARRSIESFAGRVLLVAGGRYKGGSFAELAPSLVHRQGIVLAIGEARVRLTEALGAVVPVHECLSLREALERARAEAKPGDTVLLAPACSSFDMFVDYVDRGRTYKAEVHALGDGGSA